MGDFSVKTDKSGWSVEPIRERSVLDEAKAFVERIDGHIAETKKLILDRQLFVEDLYVVKRLAEDVIRLCSEGKPVPEKYFREMMAKAIGSIKE